MVQISRGDLKRFHEASRLIEDDLEEAYLVCRQRFGADVAGVLLVTMLRSKFNDDKDQWPPPDYLDEKVDEHLVKLGLTE